MREVIGYMVFLLFVYSCEPIPKKIENNHQLVGDTLFIIEPLSIKKASSIDIELIKSKSKKGMTSFNMKTLYSKIDSYSKMDKSISDKLSGSKVRDNEDWKLTYNLEYEPFYYYEWDQKDDNFLFSFLQTDESCCFTMYFGTTDLKGENLYVDCIGTFGGDAGWTQNDIGKKMYFGTYTIESICENSVDELYKDEWITKSKFKHTQLKLSFNGGIFKRDTLNYIVTDSIYNNN